MKSVASNLVYGVPKKPISAAPANIGTPPELPINASIRGPNPLDDNPIFVTPPAPVCAKAPADKFPDKAAMSTVQGRPQVGDYLWRIDGAQTTQNFGKIRLNPSSRRQVTDVTTTSGQNFQFTTVERDVQFGSRTKISTTYEVRQGDGIYLTKIKRDVGSNAGTFAPTPAIEIFPLPGTLGNKVDSTGIDPNTLEALRVTGDVPKRMRVDACGEPLDSFLVDGTQTFFSATGASEMRNYDYGVATQLGGLIIFEHVAAPCQNEDAKDKCSPAPTLDFNANIGQVKPDPLK